MFHLHGLTVQLFLAKEIFLWKNVVRWSEMVEHLCKFLKISEKDVLNYHPVDKFVLVKRTVYAPSALTTYVILKMCSLTSPKLNDSGYEPSKREIKKYFPFVVKASMDYDFITACYNQLISK